jgi:hypothetical protein
MNLTRVTMFGWAIGCGASAAAQDAKKLNPADAKR